VAGRPRIIETLSMAFCGDCALARHGAMFPRSMATGIRSIAGSSDGAPPVFLGERRYRSRRSDGGERAIQHRQHHGSRSCLGSGRKRGAHQRALGRSRGGFTSKVHCLGDARGRPIAFHLTPGEAADCKGYDTLIDLPERAPDALLADKAYDTDAIRADLKARGIKPVIPPKSNRTATIRYSKRLYLALAQPDFRC
jgi:hypothetical protein